MGLHVEDELVLRPVFLEGLGVVDLFGVDLVGIAVGLVERHERGCHSAAATEEVTARAALAAGGTFADCGEPVLVLLLLGRLRRRHKLFVGRDSRGDRRQEVIFGVQIRLTNPH